MKTSLPENENRNNVLRIIKELKEYCIKAGLPMFATVYIPEKEEYVSDILSPTVLGVELNPDRITEHLNVANGFLTSPPPDILLRLNSDGVLEEPVADDNSEILAGLEDCIADTEAINSD